MVLPVAVGLLVLQLDYVGLTPSSRVEVMTAPEIIPAGREAIRHSRSSSVYSWAGRGTASDYLPSSSNALLEQTSSSPTDLTGGFASNEIDYLQALGLVVDSGLSTAQAYTAAKAISGSDLFRATVTDVFRDPGLRAIATEFFSRGGRLVEVIDEQGRYIPSQSRINASVKSADRGAARGIVVFHEFMHFFHDRSDHVLWEIHDSGGADHTAIALMEDRYTMVRRMVAGESPFHPSVNGLYGFVQPGEIGPLLSPLYESVRSEDRASLVARLNDDSLYSAYVRTGLLGAVSTNAYRARTQPGIAAFWTDDRVQDLAYLQAINFQALRIGLTIASENARGTESPEQAARRPEVRERVRVALIQFSEILQQGASEGPRAAADAALAR